MQKMASRQSSAGLLKGRKRASIGHDGVQNGGISNAGGDGSLGRDRVGDAAEGPCGRHTAAVCLLQPHAATEGCRDADGPAPICACTKPAQIISNQLRRLWLCDSMKVAEDLTAEVQQSCGSSKPCAAAGRLEGADRP